MTEATTRPVYKSANEADLRSPVIVVGIDGSKPASDALSWAAEEATLRKATLRAVYVWQIPVLGFGYLTAPINFEEWAANAADLLHGQVDSVLGEHPNLTVQRQLKEGPPAEMIIEAAAGAEMIVVGSRGRGGFSGLLLGSVSAQVVHHAQCPVVVVR
jgi:nucleotide-binding universal stress UspA family protein